MFKCILVVVLLLPTGGCAREEPDKGEPEGAVASQGSRPELEGTESQRGEARVLLRQYLEIVSVVVQSGTAEPMVPELDELSVRARGLAGTPKFSTRFARLLEVTRVIFTPIEPGAEAEVEAKLVKFVREVLGPEAPVPAGGGLAARSLPAPSNCWRRLPTPQTWPIIDWPNLTSRPRDRPSRMRSLIWALTGCR